MTPVTNLPLLGTLAGFRRFSVAEYQRLTELGFLTENDHLELIEGYLVLKMPRNPPHDGTIHRVLKWLTRVLPSDWDVRVQSAVTLADSVPEPDLAVVRTDAQGYTTRYPTAADVGLVIEVSDSTLAGERADKGRVYAGAGIPCYWIVNLPDRQVEVYTTPSGPTAVPAYGSRQDFAAGDLWLELSGQIVVGILVHDLLSGAERHPMAYSDFDLRTAVRTFGLTERDDLDLFAAVVPLPPTSFLQVWLDEFAPVALTFSSEKARSEFIITPVLAEAKRHAGPPVNVLPGVAFEVDKSQSLTGFCDFLITRSSTTFYVQGPVVAVVEAKKEDIIAGLGQCAAEMVAIRLFNEKEGTPRPAVYGCVTSGSNWRFLKLEGSTLFIDRPEYFITDPAKILGILVSITRG
jgi:Putative restriction endonuclease